MRYHISHSIYVTFKISPAISFNQLAFLNSFFLIHRLSPCRQLVAEQTLKACLKKRYKIDYRSSQLDYYALTETNICK